MHAPRILSEPPPEKAADASPAMSPLKLSNGNAVAARLLAFLLFGLPGALGFVYGTYLWLQAPATFMDPASLAELGGPLLGLGIAVVFTGLAATTDWCMTLDSQGLHVRTLMASHSYGWPDLYEVSLRRIKTRLELATGTGPALDTATRVKFAFDVAGAQSVHEVLIPQAEIESLVQLLHANGRSDLYWRSR